MTADVRLIIDPPSPGAWNMAVDEMMLNSVAATGRPVLRFYQWSEPTLSLGYFQAIGERETHEASRSCPLVRRSTGGGAIVHDHELTYSVAMPIADRWSSAAEQLYETFHRSLLAALEQFGMAAALCPQTLHGVGAAPFLCFQRRAKGDVLCGEWKIAGSAQRRRQGALLQHGSLLLARSPKAPELPGLAELQRPLGIESLIESWLKSLSEAGVFFRFSPGAWSDEETRVARGLEACRFASDQWQMRR